MADGGKEWERLYNQKIEAAKEFAEMTLHQYLPREVQGDMSKHAISIRHGRAQQAARRWLEVTIKMHKQRAS